MPAERTARRLPRERAAPGVRRRLHAGRGASPASRAAADRAAAAARAGRPSGRGQAIGVTSLAHERAGRDARAVHARVALLALLARRAVGEVDHRVHAARARARVRRARRGWSARGGSATSPDATGAYSGAMPRASGPCSRSKPFVGEDVREGLHAEAVRARHVAHAAGLAVRAVEGDPRGDGVGLDERPVRLVVVRVGRAPARLLVERLVVPEPERRYAEQLRCGLRDPRVERELRAPPGSPPRG